MQQEKTMRAPLDVMSDGSERVRYNRPGFAVFAYRTHLSDYPEGRILCHWHDDLEFVCVRKGRIRYEVNGGEFELCAGEGLFINSDQPHGVEGYPGEDCEYFAMVLHPALLGPSAYLLENFVRPLSGNERFPCRKLTSAEDWQNSVLLCVRAACELMEGDDPAAELSVMSLVFRAVALLTRHMPAPGPLAVEADRRSLSLRRMIAYLQDHYAEKLSVGDIARAGGVSVSACCESFRKHTGQTPVGYLTRYRLRKGMEQLLNPNLSVGEVARSVGFASASYFTECFKRYLHTTPLAYRRDSGEKRVAGL